ncbi:MAG: SMP-30/gluconolactonase/LRE family protein [Rhodothermaceae bacterium]|nr:SMP-30/gluconolactonase/LRE family protein [Rhodothermaceae bacterium]
MQPKTAIASQNILGEGPWWSVEEQEFYWVDIKVPCLLRWNPITNARKEWSLPDEVGTFVRSSGSHGIVALQNGIARIDLDSGELTPMMHPEKDKPWNRYNDGKCDRRGRFWVGSMDNAEQQTSGTLYRIDEDHTVTAIKSPVGISNGLGWSPDNTVMYYADSPAKCIYAYDYDIETGAATNERILVNVDKGVPDGLTVDSEGYIWNAQWGAWRVVRYAPDGSIDHILDMPVAQPTSCCFGGPDLNDLYITSARIGLSKNDLEKQPEAGNVFTVRTATPGLPESPFAG